MRIVEKPKPLEQKSAPTPVFNLPEPKVHITTSQDNSVLQAITEAVTEMSQQNRRMIDILNERTSVESVKRNFTATVEYDSEGRIVSVKLVED